MIHNFCSIGVDRKNNNSGTFEVEKGKGIVIG